MKKENGLLHRIRTFSYGYILVFLFDLAVALATVTVLLSSG